MSKYTKEERKFLDKAAIAAMQGYCGGEYTGQSGMPHEMIAEWSLKMADAMLKERKKLFGDE